MEADNYLTAVDRRSGLSRDEFIHEYALPGKPVVILDVAKDWPAMSLWTLDFFKSRYGSTEVGLANYEGEYRGTVEKYVSYMRNTADENPLYLKDWAFEAMYPELLEDYLAPKYFENWLDRVPLDRRPNWRWIYIGPAKSGGRLHVDTMGSSAWNALISGKKQWTFFPPVDRPLMYEGDVNVFNPDLEKYPLFEKAHPVCCDQYPGEIVYTPSCWWHQVLNAEDSIAVTENFINETNYKIFREQLKKRGLHKSLERLIQRIPEIGMG